VRSRPSVSPPLGGYSVHEDFSIGPASARSGSPRSSIEGDRSSASRSAFSWKRRAGDGRSSQASPQRSSLEANAASYPTRRQTVLPPSCVPASRPGAPMSVRLNGAGLRSELVRRGPDQGGLAKRARLLPETISRAVAGAARVRTRCSPSGRLTGGGAATSWMSGADGGSRFGRSRAAVRP